MRFITPILLPFLFSLCLASPAPVPAGNGHNNTAATPSSDVCSLGNQRGSACREVARKSWVETTPIFKEVTTRMPLYANTKYVLSIDCDRRRRLVGVKISQAGQPSPPRFTIVDFSHGTYNFQVPTTAKTRIEFLWQVFDLNSAMLYSDGPPASPTQAVGVSMPTWNPMPYAGPEVAQIRPSKGELAIFELPGEGANWARH
jgi:hypothetical protein